MASTPKANETIKKILISHGQMCYALLQRVQQVIQTRRQIMTFCCKLFQSIEMKRKQITMLIAVSGSCVMSLQLVKLDVLMMIIKIVEH